MRKLFLLFFFTLSIIVSNAQDLSYFLPDSVTYNSAIPKPKDVIYHEVGEYHVTHDRLVQYMKALSEAAPDRIKYETIGFTYEKRPQVLLIITSKKNHDNLEQIRKQHVSLTDPNSSASLNTSNMPAVVYIGHSIHGNEPSGANASLVSAYYLAAAQGKQIDELLDNVIILFDPSFNPDGLQRFSTWANQHKSKNLVTDPYSREFNEVWPGGRFNHYWFDLNRDWLPAVHPVSQNRLKWFHDWKPNILTDHHEQGSNSTFFFQPGVPSRVNPLTPAQNQELTGELGKYHARFLDRIGSMYFTKENYDDFYYGKGSTYPDVNGSIGILFEQASSRGHAQETVNGVLTFPFTIRNQFVTTLSTLEGAKNLRKELLDYQRSFYQTAVKEADGQTTKGYLFGNEDDKSKTQLFLEMLLRHQIAVHEIKSGLNANGFSFQPGASYIVPANQPQIRLIKSIFEKTLNYKDSLFYDITAWTMPLAYGIPNAELNASQVKSIMDNNTIKEARNDKGKITGGKAQYAYLIPWNEFYTPKALYQILNAEIRAKVSTNTFVLPNGNGSKKYPYGTIQIPVVGQTLNPDDLYKKINAIAEETGVEIFSLQNGTVIEGSDLGSSRNSIIQKPVMAMITGSGVSALDAGEVWHLMDQRMNMPLSHLESSTFNRVNLSKYNVIILSGGSYNDLNKDKLKEWVQGGGTLIGLGSATRWLSQAGISSLSFKRAKNPVDSSDAPRYVDRVEIDGAQRVNGAIFGAEADLSHPLTYGYTSSNISFFKASEIFFSKPKNPYAAPFVYKNKPLQSGWVSQENLNAIANTVPVIVNTVGGGRVINISDDINLRGFWLGGTKLLMNAIFFGRNIDGASGRTE